MIRQDLDLLTGDASSIRMLMNYVLVKAKVMSIDKLGFEPGSFSDENQSGRWGI